MPPPGKRNRTFLRVIMMAGKKRHWLNQIAVGVGDHEEHFKAHRPSRNRQSQWHPIWFDNKAPNRSLLNVLGRPRNCSSHSACNHNLGRYDLQRWFAARCPQFFRQPVKRPRTQIAEGPSDLLSSPAGRTRVAEVPSLRINMDN